MNALYLTYDGLTDALGQSQVLPYIIGLQKKGIHFNILSFEKNNTHTTKNTIETTLNENNISWTPLNYTKNPPIISTIIDLIKLKKEVKIAIKKKQIDVIHCRSYVTSLIGLWAKKKYNIPFVFDMRGFWADERVDGEIWNLNNIAYKLVFSFFKRKEKDFLIESYHTISLTEAGKNEIESWGINNSPITIIPCCTDELLFNENKIFNISDKIKIAEDDFVISYLGSIGTWYMLDEMLDFFSIVKKTIPQAKFLFITKDNKNSILDRAREKNINPNSIYITPSERKMIPSFIALSNFSIFFIKPLYSKKASSPTKMGEVMNLGIPIICNKGVGDVDSIINEVDSNFIINEFTTEEYERVTEYILNCKINSKHIIETSYKYYSLEKGISSYYNVYSQLKKK